MKVTLSSYDLACLIKELQVLVNSKVEKVYVLEDKSVFLKLHLPNKGGKFLRINVPEIMYLTDYKPSSSTPKGFCISLRRRLNQARLRKVEQINFDRIVKLEFETKESKFFIYIELFAKGNVLLCDASNKIISVLIPLKTKERKLLGGQVYELPATKYNFLELTKNDLKDMISSTEQDSLVKALAIEFQLGGNYAEEICFRSKVDKTKLKFNDKQIDKIIKVIKELHQFKISPQKYKSKIFPIEMKQFEDGTKAPENEDFGSYSEVLDKLLTESVVIEEKKQAMSSHDKKVKKLDNIVKKQKQQLDKAIRDSEENKRKGDLLYENYNEIKKLLTNIKKAREEYSWKEIKEHLASNKQIKKINEKNNEIILDI